MVTPIEQYYHEDVLILESSQGVLKFNNVGFTKDFFFALQRGGDVLVPNAKH